MPCGLELCEESARDSLDREAAEEEFLKGSYEKGLDKRFFSYSNWEGDCSPETRSAAVSAWPASKPTSVEGTAEHAAGMRTWHLKVLLSTLGWKSGDARGADGAEVLLQLVGSHCDMMSSHTLPFPGWFYLLSGLQVTAAAFRGLRWITKKGESLRICWATDSWSSFCCCFTLTLEDSNLSHFCVSCFWWVWFLAFFFSLFSPPLCTQQEESLAKPSRVRRRRTQKGPDDLCFLQAELKAGSSQCCPRASHHPLLCP